LVVYRNDDSLFGKRIKESPENKSGNAAIICVQETRLATANNNNNNNRICIAQVCRMTSEALTANG